MWSKFSHFVMQKRDVEDLIVSIHPLHNCIPYGYIGSTLGFSHLPNPTSTAGCKLTTYAHTICVVVSVCVCVTAQSDWFHNLMSFGVCLISVHLWSTGKITSKFCFGGFFPHETCLSLLVQYHTAVKCIIICRVLLFNMSQLEIQPRWHFQLTQVLLAKANKICQQRFLFPLEKSAVSVYEMTSLPLFH